MIMVLDWEIIETDGFKISICTLLFCIWVAGTMGFFIRLLHQYYYSIKKIGGFDKREDIQMQAIFECVQQNSKKKISANVLCSSHIDVPMRIGIVHRFILLTDKTEELFQTCNLLNLKCKEITILSLHGLQPAIFEIKEY